MNLYDETHIVLDLSIHRVVNVVCSQDDMNSRKLYIRLTNDGKPYPIDDTIGIEYKLCKPDNKYVYNEVDGITDDGEIFIDLTEQCLTCVGVAQSEIRLIKPTSAIGSDDGQIISTMPFNVTVRPSVISNEALESTDEFGKLNKLIAESESLNKVLENVQELMDTNEQNFINMRNELENYTDTSVSTHNTDTSAHNDIRDLITGLTNRLNTLANSDDATLDQMKEVVDYIKANRSLIESVTTSKVNVADIIDNLTTNVVNKPLSAAQGVVLKGLIDTLQTAKANADFSNVTGTLPVSKGGTGPTQLLV